MKGLAVAFCLMTIAWLVMLVGSMQHNVEIDNLEVEVSHYKQLAQDNANDVTYWKQEAMNWKVLFEASPNEAWIIIENGKVVILEENPWE